MFTLNIYNCYSTKNDNYIQVYSSQLIPAYGCYTFTGSKVFIPNVHYFRSTQIFSYLISYLCICKSLHVFWCSLFSFPSFLSHFNICWQVAPSPFRKCSRNYYQNLCPWKLFPAMKNHNIVNINLYFCVYCKYGGEEYKTFVYLISLDSIDYIKDIFSYRAKTLFI